MSDQIRMTDQFTPCLAFTLKEEGGDCTLDGATNLGITLATLSHWRGTTCTPADVIDLTPAAVTPIYRATYWNVLRCWALPVGIDLMVFDFGVNAGPYRSALLLQAAVGTDQDGVIGPLTAIAARGAGAKMAVPMLYAAQAAYYRSCARFAEFGSGWLARSARRRDAALAMAGVAIPAAA